MAMTTRAWMVTTTRVHMSTTLHVQWLNLCVLSGPPGTFSALISCTFPTLEVSDDIEALRDAGDCELELVVDVAPNGVDFFGGCKIPAFCTCHCCCCCCFRHPSHFTLCTTRAAPTLDAVVPGIGDLVDRVKYTLKGKGFVEMKGTKARFAAGGKNWV